MIGAWILLCLLISGGRTFMIHNSQQNLCLEDSMDTGEVLLKECNLSSELQQWVWISHNMLMCVGSSRCLSAQQNKPILTQSCHTSDAAVLKWNCDGGRLISSSTLMLLTTNRDRLSLTKHSKHSKWTSLDEGDICQETLRLRRDSGNQDQHESAGDPAGDLAIMTKEQREYLHWFYRTEDSTTWTFVLLGFAFVCLLVGFLLLGMGAVTNKSRKKIAEYKAAALIIRKSRDDEQQVFAHHRDNGTAPQHDELLQAPEPPTIKGDTCELTAGNIVVTWKDGNTSCLYSDLQVEARQVEKWDEVPDVEREACDGVCVQMRE